MKSDHIEGHSLFALVRIIKYTLRPILPESSCICMSQSDSMILSGKFFFSPKSISSSQRLTSGYEAWSCTLDVWSTLPFGTRQITTVKVVFGNCKRLHLALLPACSIKSVAGFPVALPFLLPRLPNLTYTFLQIIPTHCRRMLSALSKCLKGSQVSKFSKQSATTVSQCRGLSRSCFKWFCLWIMDRCLYSRNPATSTIFHLLKALKLCCLILLANCFLENFICFKLIEALSLAPPKSDESLLS